MNLQDLAGMFSQKTGAQQSIGSTIMSTITTYLMQNFMQRGLGGFLGSGGNDKDSMKSALSTLKNETDNPNDGLVQMVKRNCNLKDDQEAQKYTQQAVKVLQEDTDNEPQGLQSVFRNLAGNQGFDLGSLLGGGSQDQKGQQKSSGLGDLLGF
jgi:hypothetical protein